MAATILHLTTGVVYVRSFSGTLSGGSFQAGSTGSIGWSDATWFREGADHIFQRNGTTAQRASWANTYTSATNYEAFSVDWQTTANVATVGMRTAATGTGRPLRLVSQGTNAATYYGTVNLSGQTYPTIDAGLATAALGNVNYDSGSTPAIQFMAHMTNTGASGSQPGVAILNTYNQSGTAGGIDLLINRTQTAVGSGAQLLADFQVGSVSKFSVSNGGNVSAANYLASNTIYGNAAATASALRGTTNGQWLFLNNGETAGVGFDFTTDSTLTINNRAQTGAASVGLGPSASATSTRTLVKKVTGIADNTATDVLTVTVPNANHAATIKLTLLSSNGSTDAFESSRTALGSVVVARTTGANAVAAVSTLTLTQIATVAAGATHTLAYGVSAISGAVGDPNTFTIQVTIDDSGNLGSNQVVCLAELINAEATGITIS